MDYAPISKFPASSSKSRHVTILFDVPLRWYIHRSGQCEQLKTNTLEIPLANRHRQGCRQSLDALRTFPTWTTYGGAGTLSNNILGAAPQHPFWEELINSIQRYAWNYPLPYITISYATGQWFFSDVWRRYHLNLPADDPGLMYMWMSHFEGQPDDIFFNYGRGGTWEGWDNAWFKSIGDHLFLVGAIVATILGVVAYLVVRRRRRLEKGAYSKIESAV